MISTGQSEHQQAVHMICEWFPVLMSLCQWKSPPQPNLCTLAGSKPAQGLLPCSPISALLRLQDRLDTFLGRVLLSTSSSLPWDGVSLHQPGCSYERVQSSLQRLGVGIRNVTVLIRPQRWNGFLKSSGWWPQLPEAVTNCLSMTQMTGSNFSPVQAPGQEWPAWLFLLSISWWKAGL